MEYEYDRSTGVYRTNHDFDGEGTLSTTVVLLLREVTGADANETSPLFDVVDPEGLDSLFRPSETVRRDDGHVRFRFEGHEVTCFADGRVEIRPPSA